MPLAERCRHEASRHHGSRCHGCLCFKWRGGRGRGGGREKRCQRLGPRCKWTGGWLDTVLFVVFLVDTFVLRDVPTKNRELLYVEVTRRACFSGESRVMSDGLETFQRLPLFWARLLSFWARVCYPSEVLGFDCSKEGCARMDSYCSI